MAEKVKESTLIIEVDLACEMCHKKIQKVLCKLQVKENIRSIAFDSKNNTVTITGPFDRDKLSHKLLCKAGCAIKAIKDKPPPPPPTTPPPPPPPPPPPVIKKEPVATASASATVNLGFTQVCMLCYPWPCSDPISHCSHSKQIRYCEGVPAPAVVPNSTCGGVPAKCISDACSGPPCSRGGCGNSCGTGGGTHGCTARPAQPCCPGPSACRGCMGCRGGCGNSCGTGGGAHGCPATPARPCCPGPPACRGCKVGRVVHEETHCAIM